MNLRANSILKFPRKISKDFSLPNSFHAFVIASVVPQSSALLLPLSPPIVWWGHFRCRLCSDVSSSR